MLWRQARRIRVALAIALEIVTYGRSGLGVVRWLGERKIARFFGYETKTEPDKSLTLAATKRRAASLLFRVNEQC